MINYLPPPGWQEQHALSARRNATVFNVTNFTGLMRCQTCSALVDQMFQAEHVNGHLLEAHMIAQVEYLADRLQKLEQLLTEQQKRRDEEEVIRSITGGGH